MVIKKNKLIKFSTSGSLINWRKNLFFIIIDFCLTISVLIPHIVINFYLSWTWNIRFQIKILKKESRSNSWYLGMGVEDEPTE